MKCLIYELRLLMAEVMLTLAIAIAPPGLHGVAMAKLVRGYIEWDIEQRVEMKRSA